MTDLNEKLAQEAAELINGGEWRDGKWYSEGHRDAWRRALKPAADRIEELGAANDMLSCDALQLYARIEKLQAALDDALQYVSRADWHYLKDETRKALEGENGN